MLTAAEAPAAAPSDDAYVPLAVIQRHTGLSVGSIKSAAIAKAIRARAIPGCRIMYRFGDARALVEGGRSLALA